MKRWMGLFLLVGCAGSDDGHLDQTSAVTSTDPTIAVTTGDQTTTGDYSTLTTGTHTDNYPSTWCWTLRPAQYDALELLHVAMPSGVVTVADNLSSPGTTGSFHTDGIGRVGDILGFSGYNGNNFAHFRADLSNGIVTMGSPSAHAVTSDGASWISASGVNEICWYDQFADVGSANATGCISESATTSRHAWSGDKIYGAWHSTSEIEVFSAVDGSPIDILQIPDWDTWVWGISVAGGMVHLIDDDRGNYAGQGVRIARYDKVTGAFIDHVFLPDGAMSQGSSGLWCEAV